MTLGILGPELGPNRWQWPLGGQQHVAQPFDRPASDYAAGHRGVDLYGKTGDVVTAVAAGQITFVGNIAGVGVVSIDHGLADSTYQPVVSHIAVGTTVTAGTPIGRLVQRGSHCEARPCLHLGRKIDNRYTDPMALLRRSARIRLISPSGKPPTKPAFGATTEKLSVPVDGPITSPFGQRVHPITGVQKLHDGLDIGAACGTPIRAAANGVVIARYFNAAYGQRLIVQHPNGIRTSYNHLSRFRVHQGVAVSAGQVIGNVGTSGYSTGCHLHFMVYVEGRPVDPQGWL